MLLIDIILKLNVMELIRNTDHACLINFNLVNHTLIDGNKDP